MFKAAWFVLLVVVSATAARGQMVVHAVSGQVNKVQVAPETADITVAPDGTEHFKLLSDKSTPLEFDSALRAEASAPAQFSHVGDYAVVYFYGYNSDQTVVALKDLGPGPFQKVDGTVTGFDKHDRTMAMTDDAGHALKLKLDDQLVVDTNESVDSGRKFAPHKGDRVRVTYSAANDDAVFFRELR